SPDGRGRAAGLGGYRTCCERYGGQSGNPLDHRRRTPVRMTTLQGWRFERLSWECPRKSEVSAASDETRGDAICGALDATKCREPGNGAGGPGDSRVRAMLAARNSAANRRHRAEAMKASAPSLHSASAHRATRIPEIGVGEKLARHLPPPAV